MSPYVYLLLTTYNKEYQELAKFAIKVDLNALPRGWETIQYWRENIQTFLNLLPEDTGEGLILVDVHEINGIFL